MGKVARDFSTTVNYSIGDICLYDGILYEFISSHSAGAWNFAHVKLYDDNLTQIWETALEANESLRHSLSFADSLVFDTQLIGTARYKFILLN